jgi:hypothetical protein
MALLQKVQQIILRTGSGPVLDALLLALCLKTIALKTQSYATIASWAQALSAEHRDLKTALNKLHQTEKRAESEFQRFAPECDIAAAAVNLETTRKREHSATKQPKEPFRAPGDW